MYYTPGHFFKKSATGCKVHNYSYPLAQFVENNTLDQFVENNTLDQFVENYTLENYMVSDCAFIWGCQSIFPHTDSIRWCEQASSAAQACKE